MKHKLTLTSPDPSVRSAARDFVRSIIEAAGAFGAFAGDQAGTADRTRKLFARGHPPELVARDIVVAIRENKAVLASGWESRLGWWAARLLPLRVQQIVAGAGR